MSRYAPPMSAKERESVFNRLHIKRLSIPIEVLELYMARVLNSTEVILLAIIDGAVNIRKEGCFITNPELAKCLRLRDPQDVSNMKRKFKNLNLIREIGYKLIHGRKVPVLETKWSPVLRENTPPWIKPDDDSGNFQPYCILSNTEIQETGSEAPPLRPQPEENNMGFFERMNIENPKKNTRFDVQCSKQLFNAIKTIPSLPVTYNENKWCVTFRKLRKSVPIGLISTVLDWYEINASKLSKPRLQNAKQFLTNFEWLRSLMEKDQKDKVEISPEAHRIWEQLKHYRWQKSDKVLPAIQITLDNFRSFGEKLSEFCRNNPKEIQVGKNTTRNAEDYVRAAHYLWDLHRPESRTADWFTEMFKRVSNYKEWYSDPIKEAFDGNINHPQFANHMINKIGQYMHGNAYQIWTRLAEELK